MTRAFGWAERQGFEAGILLTDKPALYEAFGFQIVPQFQFQIAVARGSHSAPERRDLDLKQAADLQIVQSALEPGSRSLRSSPRCDKGNVPAQCAFRPADPIEPPADEDAVVAWKTRGSLSLQILDIAARRIPSLARITACLGAGFEQADVFFPMDRLGCDGLRQAMKAHAC